MRLQAREKSMKTKKPKKTKRRKSKTRTRTHRQIDREMDLFVRLPNT